MIVSVQRLSINTFVRNSFGSYAKQSQKYLASWGQSKLFCAWLYLLWEESVNHVPCHVQVDMHAFLQPSLPAFQSHWGCEHDCWTRGNGLINSLLSQRMVWLQPHHWFWFLFSETFKNLQSLTYYFAGIGPLPNSTHWVFIFLAALMVLLCMVENVVN